MLAALRFFSEGIPLPSYPYVVVEPLLRSIFISVTVLPLSHSLAWLCYCRLRHDQHTVQIRINMDTMCKCIPEFTTAMKGAEVPSVRAIL